MFNGLLNLVVLLKIFDIFFIFEVFYFEMFWLNFVVCENVLEMLFIFLRFYLLILLIVCDFKRWNVWYKDWILSGRFFGILMVFIGIVVIVIIVRINIIN